MLTGSTERPDGAWCGLDRALTGPSGLTGLDAAADSVARQGGEGGFRGYVRRGQARDVRRAPLYATPYAYSYYSVRVQ